MSISLASPDGRVVGGTLAGLLIAASPVQVTYLCTIARILITEGGQSYAQILLFQYIRL